MSDWRAAIASYSSQIREGTDPVVHESLVCDFSTTTADARTASQVVLMDSLSEYFEFRMAIICGIPRITLTGSPEDWQRIRQRLEVLSTFDLEWWAFRLRPILDEFVKTSQGAISQEFWQSIYSSTPTYRGPCGGKSPTPTGHAITGWIGDLVPYLGNDSQRRRRNSVFEKPRSNWRQLKMPAAPDAFPRGYSMVEVSGSNGFSDFKFLAGFLGVVQSSSDMAVSPGIGWAVFEA